MQDLTEYETLRRDCGIALSHPIFLRYVPKDDIYVVDDGDGCTHEWYEGKDVRRLRELTDQRRAA